MPGKAPVELVRGRHGADDEPEVLANPRGDRVRRESQRHRVGHVRVDDRRERQQEVAVLGRRLARQDRLDLVENGPAPAGVGCDHSGLQGSVERCYYGLATRGERSPPVGDVKLGARPEAGGEP